MAEIMSRGQEMAKIWPRNIKTLNAVYREGFIASMVVYAGRWMPPMLCFFAVWYFCFWRFSGVEIPSYIWPSAVFMLMLAFLAPVWGIWKLGQRSLRRLTPQEISWYGRICGETGDTPALNPDMLTLARALRKALDREGADPRALTDGI
ncbi:MAG: DUF412 family protein [Succinimonas sp.]|nr:DUF412 family protein [Succinimonas sp.]